ncbi:protein disulfide-isomerase A5 [Zerene cesonia]|uniref:protein disulfide-isomerase A5 n=1 Tax=Zerene cesonia TaxID=33412 RepID=UPI0018E5229C|nr:protein disulfide-isomerase A5 [Zerene cesonia]
MRVSMFLRFSLLLFFLFIQKSEQVKKQTSSITQVDDFKEFKKLMRTKTNVLALYINNHKNAKPILATFGEVANKMKGRATLVSIDCVGSEGKKLCKKLKTETTAPYYIKHYKDGEFNKDYERAETVNSIVNFLLDPTGDAPWEEDPTATDVYHLANSAAITNFLKKASATFMNALIMFYAPWCGYCKILKPEYAKAAKDLKGEAMLAAIDVSKPDNAKIRTEFNITGFPTIFYYEKGRFRMVYNGDNKREALVKFVRDPNSVEEVKKDAPTSWTEDTQLLHLTAKNFDFSLVAIEHALVVFYAPWCGHCKNLKPNLVRAQEIMQAEKIEGLIAVVDVTEQRELGSRFNVKGYPTMKYFHRGQYQYDINHRTDDKIVEFMKDPQEAAVPPSEKPWTEEESAVRHLTTDTFKYALRKVKHALVMFYAPWCGHCQSTKPEFVKAAEKFADDLMILFGAVDCTVETGLCSTMKIKGYPTLKYFNHYEKIEDYSGGRKMANFVQYIHTQIDATLMQEKGIKSHTMDGFGVNVILANDDNFMHILGDTVPSFVMFHAQWCGHCNEAKPAFSRLATQLKNENVSIKIVAIDVTDNLKATDFGQIKTLPTFKLYSEATLLAVYEGDRTLEDMHSFCRHSLQVNEEL